MNIAAPPTSTNRLPNKTITRPPPVPVVATDRVTVVATSDEVELDDDVDVVDEVDEVDDVDDVVGPPCSTDVVVTDGSVDVVVGPPCSTDVVVTDGSVDVVVDDCGTVVVVVGYEEVVVVDDCGTVVVVVGYEEVVVVDDCGTVVVVEGAVEPSQTLDSTNFTLESIETGAISANEPSAARSVGRRPSGTST